MIRYLRHLISPEIQQEGQTLLKESKTLVIGAGGLGTPVLGYLVGAGCGQVDFFEYDIIEISNLHRQFFYKTHQCGEFKGKIMEHHLKALNPEVQTHWYNQKIQDYTDVPLLFSRYDIIVDATDNFETKRFLHDQTYRAHKPFITSSVRDFYGTITCYKGYLHKFPCMSCITETLPKTQGPLPVVGPVPGVFGSLQALEVLKEILNIHSLAGYQLTIDLLENTFLKLKMPKNPHCVLCADVSVT